MNAHIDITKAMQAKSDQLNAEDLIAGPRTIRVRDVSERDGKIRVGFDGDEGRPWVLSKTAVRALAACWGTDAAKWVGLHCTVFCDPEVVYGGVKVGGIRVSHVEGITAPRALMLTVTRGKKKEHLIQPLTVEKKTKADAWRERLLAVASDTAKDLEFAWGKTGEDIREQLGGAAFHEQLLQIRAAAQEHANSDGAVLDDLNKAITGE
jgi:hypothetical protein